MTSYKLPCIITRGNNVYGPHQFPEKMIPKFTLLAMAGRELPLHGDGMSVRSYLYVEDVAEAFDTVLHHGKARCQKPLRGVFAGFCGGGLGLVRKWLCGEGQSSFRVL